MLQAASITLEHSQLLNPICENKFSRILPSPSFYPRDLHMYSRRILEIKSCPETCNFPGRVCMQLFSYLHNGPTIFHLVYREHSALNASGATLGYWIFRLIPFVNTRKSRGGVGLISKICGWTDRNSCMKT